MPFDSLFQPLQFRNLTVKNRIFRSNMSGRFDNYDGSGNQARINWELKFARNGVGAIISSFCSVHPRGRIMPNYALIDRDDRVPFWREVGKRVHEHDCRFILQLSHGGRQRDLPGIEYKKGLSSTNQIEPWNGFEAERMSKAQIDEVVAAFAAAAARARAAGLDGVELHACNGYLITQFLSSAINDRNDAYGGPLENRARFLLEIIAAIRAEVGSDFHLQAKVTGTDYNNAMNPFEPPGNTIQDAVRVCQWLEQAGVDAIHVSNGNAFPHPKNPPGDFPVAEAATTFDTMISSGRHGLRNFTIINDPLLGAMFRAAWVHARGPVIEGINLPDAHAIKQAVSLPVICTGGFQTASVAQDAIDSGACDAISIARPLIANNDLVQQWAAGNDSPERPCTYCNKCLVNVIENPLGCYEQSRFASREEMVKAILSVFDPPPFALP